MELNKEDMGNRKYILCTLDEKHILSVMVKIPKDDNTSKHRLKMDMNLLIKYRGET